MNATRKQTKMDMNLTAIIVDVVVPREEAKIDAFTLSVQAEVRKAAVPVQRTIAVEASRVDAMMEFRRV